MTRKKTSSRKRPQRARRRSGVRIALLALSLALVATGLVSIGYLAHLDTVVRAKFEGKRWAVPARVYARPLELYAGAPITAEQFARELDSLGYRRVQSPTTPGTYARSGERFHVIARPFRFWDGTEPSRPMELLFAGRRLQTLESEGAPLALARLEPPHIASIYPAHQEDRILVRLDEVPRGLIAALLVVEDRNFYEHRGIEPRAIARALLANLRAGRAVQGGSTLTQQLVKNFYLDPSQTLWRKANEAMMALLLERRYDKDAILEAYLNEIYLGQDGNRAIHGFGLASRFYFARPLEELDISQLALLAGLARGASYYDPRRQPERARQRRDRVLDLLAQHGLLDQDQLLRAKGRALDVVRQPPGGVTPYPAFVELVRRQLRRDYREADLASEGLQIFTTLDPFLQADVEHSLAERLRGLEARSEVPQGLQGAAVVSSVPNGEILALVGDRNARLAGFNRALDAVRPIGSLIKPAIYVAALEQRRYTLASLLPDTPISLQTIDGTLWTPQNYDGRFVGEVSVFRALADSRNLPTVHLGLELGVDEVLRTVRRLGVVRPTRPFPSVLLGAGGMSPYEVAQMYQTFANGGYHTPLRAIREVLTSDGQVLQRYPLAWHQSVDPGAVYLVNSVMQAAARDGTAQALSWRAPELAAAGKTGTTNDQRDSWFAGFTSDRLAVVWVGMDDNRPTGLDGSGGALPLWSDIMRRSHAQPLVLTPPAEVEQVWVVPGVGRAAEHCTDAISVGFISGTAPEEWHPCAGPAARRTNDGSGWLRGMFR